MGITSIKDKWTNMFFIVAYFVHVIIIFYDKKNRQQSHNVIGMTIWIIPIMILLYNGIARLTHIGAETEDLFIALIYYGTSLLFIVIGNYLPKIKQNNTIGIRIVLTLQDEENWNATHSFSGRIWRASGILCMLCKLHLIKTVSKEACIKAK